MSAAVEKILADALALYDAEAMRLEIARALSAMRQQPVRIDDLGLHRRLTERVKAMGSVAAFARKCGVSRQYMTTVIDGTRPASDAVIAQLGLRRVGQRTLYTPLD